METLQHTATHCRIWDLLRFLDAELPVGIAVGLFDLLVEDRALLNRK